jgi:hypothetical protein
MNKPVGYAYLTQGYPVVKYGSVKRIKKGIFGWKPGGMV